MLSERRWFTPNLPRQTSGSLRKSVGLLTRAARLWHPDSNPLPVARRRWLRVHQEPVGHGLSTRCIEETSRFLSGVIIWPA